MNKKTNKKTNKNKQKIVNKKYTKKKYMKGGSVKQFLKNIKESKEIGRGGAGIVYLDKSQDDSVFKVSNKLDTCRIWGKESKIYERLNKINIDTDLCKLIKMKEYFSDEISCCMELTRVYNPINKDFNYTIHPQFQYNDLDYLNKGRGHFLGISQLKKLNIFTDKNIKDYIKELAILLARLHYKHKNDGYDLEVFVGKDLNNQITLYIGDFDLSEFYENMNEKIISRLSWSLASVPYFPIEDELYDIFSDNYLKEASKYNMKETAEMVLKEYIS
jgi:hypothetical protein